MLAQEYYEATVKHRRLQWYYHHGYANLRGNFRSKPIDITASTTQAAVLLLFNAGARMPPPSPVPLPCQSGHSIHQIGCTLATLVHFPTCSVVFLLLYITCHTLSDL